MEQAKRLVLVTGAAGMLGGEVYRIAPTEAVGIAREDCDLADPARFKALFDAITPDAVIHVAGFTDVDGAERDPDAARRDNVEATANVAAACRGLPWLMVSTDYVFDGKSDRPYAETDEPNPINVYGRTKLEAEHAAEGAVIVRTSWLYGPGGRHFPGRIVELAAEREELKVVDDQRGSPTSTLELAPLLWTLLDQPAGVYHAACEGSCSWYELARAIVEIEGLDVRVKPCTTAELPRPAPRPAYSVLDCARLGRPLAPWRVALERFLKT